MADIKVHPVCDAPGCKTQDESVYQAADVATPFNLCDRHREERDADWHIPERGWGSDD